MSQNARAVPWQQVKHWLGLILAAGGGLAVIVLLPQQPQLALSIAACLLVGIVSALATYQTVTREVDPIQVRYGDSTIRLRLDSSRLDDETRYQITAGVAEFALDCLRQGRVPAWRPTTSPVLPAAEPMLQPTSPPVVEEVTVEPQRPQCEVCHSRPSTGESYGRQLCSKCRTILAKGANGELQAAAVSAAD